jgi:hypothetical protein
MIAGQPACATVVNPEPLSSISAAGSYNQSLLRKRNRKTIGRQIISSMAATNVSGLVNPGMVSAKFIPKKLVITVKGKVTTLMMASVFMILFNRLLILDM